MRNTIIRITRMSGPPRRRTRLRTTVEAMKTTVTAATARMVTTTHPSDQVMFTPTWTDVSTSVSGLHRKPDRSSQASHPS